MKWATAVVANLFSQARCGCKNKKQQCNPCQYRCKEVNAVIFFCDRGIRACLFWKMNGWSSNHLCHLSTKYSLSRVQLRSMQYLANDNKRRHHCFHWVLISNHKQHQIVKVDKETIIYFWKLAQPACKYRCYESKNLGPEYQRSWYEIISGNCSRKVNSKQWKKMPGVNVRDSILLSKEGLIQIWILLRSIFHLLRILCNLHSKQWTNFDLDKCQ